MRNLSNQHCAGGGGSGGGRGSDSGEKEVRERSLEKLVEVEQRRDSRERDWEGRR